MAVSRKWPTCSEDDRLKGEKMKFNFPNYLTVVEGISYSYYDNNYDGQQAAEIEARYMQYDTANWEADVERYLETWEPEDEE